MNRYDVENTHTALRNRLIEYIRSQYLGENDLLLNACKQILSEEGNLYRTPYIEANPAYLTEKNGIGKADIPQHTKKFLTDMSTNRLGVYQNPFKHQIDAVEYFYKGKNLFITTGTGSGKTECFMWPMISSLSEESLLRPESWQIRGVRALLLYPMNALVSDQVGRLRRIIGDQKGKFRELFRENAENSNVRIPQFGMYTSRTPYSGQQDIKQDKSLAVTLEKDIACREMEIIEKLKKIGKYPAKADLNSYISDLMSGMHITNENDAELLTRFEIQQTCPDILITNYSMLEYMLLRPREQEIWNSTKTWLDCNSSNKLLIIIDEAHMYKGASGGEVALLLRRLMYRLGIDIDRIRFILTSASMPHDTEDDKKSIYKFATDFTAQNTPGGNFEIIFGSTERIEEEGSRDISVEKLITLDVDAFQLDDETKVKAINSFAEKVCSKKVVFTSLSEAEDWLYNNLTNYARFLKLMKLCRGNAATFQEIAAECFPDICPEKAMAATQAMLMVAPLARNKEGRVLFPARLHMLFKGLSGLFACSNPSCLDKNSGDGITLGKIYSTDSVKECECGGQVYELLNDRRCGALFLKVFMRDNKERRNFAWNNPGCVYGEELKEVHLYIVPDDQIIKASKDLKIGWLDSKTGFVYYDDDTHAGKEGFIKVVQNFKELKSKPNELTFGKCPKCGTNLKYYSLSDFKTKGNEPFFNIIKEQLRTQPETIFNQDKLKSYPNAGRKVLLFSDSRQRAAVLAKDMTRSADDEASRQIMTIAAIKLQRWAKKNNKFPSIQPYLYPAFLEVAYENSVQFFYGEDRKDFKDHVNKISVKIERSKKRGEEPDYAWLEGYFNTQPGLYYEQLLKLLCDKYRALSDSGILWLEASSEMDIKRVCYELDDEGIEISKDDLYILFSCWATVIAKEYFAIGDTIPDQIRENIIKRDRERFGVDEDRLCPEHIREILFQNGFSQGNIDKIFLALKREFMQKIEGRTTFYLNLKKLQLCFDKEQKWYRCRKCTGVYAHNLWGKCAFCGNESIVEFTQDDLVSRYTFWNKSILEAVNNAEIGKHSVKSINTEEHTAQLSHKDQRDNMWSTTEKFEMLFQDIQMDDEMPIDILSCTTTMEVGIDIGSLTAVGLRNVPPMRENYQQRAGRAGRRGTSISTITTYAQNGPHDNYYFLNPKAIIAGKVRRPWIDTENQKLLKRHISMVSINSFMFSCGMSIDDCSAVRFFNELYPQFKEYLSAWKLKDVEVMLLLPETHCSIADEFKKWLIAELDKIEKPVKERPELYSPDNGQIKTILDILFESGVLPTYSFPKNVIGLYIEKENGAKIDQKPERALDIAISEYAPGKVLVVNKKTYKVGGIYSFNSKFKPNYYEKQAMPYFEDENYIKTLYECSESACGWFGTDYPENGNCPFCCKEKVQARTRMLKPWGFAPLDGKSIRESEAENEQSFAEEPCYSTTPKQDDMDKTPYKNIRIAKRADQTIVVLNKGPQGKAFNVCTECGAAVVGDEPLSAESIGRPYRHPFVKTGFKCKHQSNEEVYLGHQFLTDMVVFEFAIDREKIDVQSKLWLKRAAVSLSEAFALAVSRIMDIEFNDIKAGYRIRYNKDNVWIDIYLYDSLSSGAGYSSGVPEFRDEVMNEAKKILEACDCDEACNNCLKHYWNQRVEAHLDRKAALQLLFWGVKGELAPSLSAEQQWTIFKPLKRLLDLERKIESRLADNAIELCCGEKRKRVLIYPAMWNNESAKFDCNVIMLADKLIKSALPKAYEELKKHW